MADVVVVDVTGRCAVSRHFVPTLCARPTILQVLYRVTIAPAPPRDNEENDDDGDDEH